jgi:hypothetical protein
VTLDPASSQALHFRGYAKGALDDLAGCFADESAAIALDPSLSVAWMNRGFCGLRLRRPAGAIEDFTRTIELSPGVSLAWDGRGMARAAAGDLDGHRGLHARRRAGRGERGCTTAPRAGRRAARPRALSARDTPGAHERRGSRPDECFEGLQVRIQAPACLFRSLLAGVV